MKKHFTLTVLSMLLMVVSICSMAACGNKKDKLTMYITESTWNSEAYTITNPTYQFDNDDGGKKVVFNHFKKSMDVVLYVTPAKGYSLEGAMMRAVTPDYLEENKDYRSFTVQKEDNDKIVIKNVTEDFVFIIEKVRQSSMSIVFNANGGTFAVNEDEVANATTYTKYVYWNGSENVNTSVSVVNPTRENYQFGGWYRDHACTISYDINHITKIENVHLYAKWIEKSVVTFDSQGGSSVVSIDAYNSTITEPKAPTRERYRFDGWYKEASCTTLFDFTTEVVASDITLYAKWVEQVEVTLITGDGMDELLPVWVDKGTVATNIPKVEITTFVDTGIVLDVDGWSLTDGGEQLDLTTYQFTQDTTLYALYQQYGNIMVAYTNAQNQDMIAEIYFDDFLPVEPTHEEGSVEYLFEGYTLEECADLPELVVLLNDETITTLTMKVYTYDKTSVIGTVSATASNGVFSFAIPALTTGCYITFED